MLTFPVLFLARCDGDRSEVAPAMFGDVVLHCAAIGQDGQETHQIAFRTGPEGATHAVFQHDTAPRCELIWSFKEHRDGADIYLIERRTPTWHRADSIEIKEFQFTRSPVVVFEEPSFRITVHPNRF